MWCASPLRCPLAHPLLEIGTVAILRMYQLILSPKSQINCPCVHLHVLRNCYIYLMWLSFHYFAGSRFRCIDFNMNPAATLCCNGIVYIKSGHEPGCCGYIGYDNRDSICCGNKVLPRRGHVTHCCGDKAYDASLDICENGLVSQPQWAPMRNRDSSYDATGIVRKSGFRPACCWIRNRAVRGDCCASVKQLTGMLPSCCDSPGLRPVCCLDLYSALICCNKRHPTCCPDTPDPDHIRMPRPDDAGHRPLPHRENADSFALPTAQVMNRGGGGSDRSTSHREFRQTLEVRRFTPKKNNEGSETLPWPLVGEVPTNSYGDVIVNGEVDNSNENDKDGPYKADHTPSYHNNVYNVRIVPTAEATEKRKPIETSSTDDGHTSEKHQVIDPRHEASPTSRYDVSSRTNQIGENTDGSGDEHIPAGGVPVSGNSFSSFWTYQRDAGAPYDTRERPIQAPTKQQRIADEIQWRPSCCLSTQVRKCCEMMIQRTGVEPECCRSDRHKLRHHSHHQRRRHLADQKCQRRAYNHRTHICCLGYVRRKKGVQPECCGHVMYDAYRYVCCNESVIATSCSRLYNNQWFRPQAK